MNKMKSVVLGSIALVLAMSSYALRAEEVMPRTGIAGRLAEREAFVSPFQVIVDQKGQLVVEPKSVFSEGAQDSELELPQLLTDPKPISLPSSVLNQKWEGEVVLAVAVQIDGTISETMVMKSSGDETLDQWATELVQSWRFHPAMKQGKPVYECIQIPILFKLKS